MNTPYFYNLIKLKSFVVSGKIKNAKKVIFNDVQFQSHLEKTMYSLLLSKNMIENKDFYYEKVTVTLIDNFICLNNIWVSKKGKSKVKSFVKESTKVRPITYTPDFMDNLDPLKAKWIIETKGRANEVFPMRFKLFKRWLSINNSTCQIYVPSNKEQCEQVIKLLTNDES